MYDSLTVWLALVLAGIVGCVTTAIFANSLAGFPLSAVAGKPGKHLWSVIFALPVPFLLTLGGGAGMAIAFVWLMFAPTAGSKFYFGPKQAPWMTLFAFHSGYGVAVLAVYYLVLWLAG